MKKVADILTRKGGQVITVTAETTVIDALQMMADHNIGSVMVMEGRKFLGIMTERDYSRKVVLNGKSSTDTRVGEIMSTSFPQVTPRDTIEYCMQLLSDRNIRYLPVMKEDEVCGIISINDVVKETIHAQQETITHLQDFLNL